MEAPRKFLPFFRVSCVLFLFMITTSTAFAQNSVFLLDLTPKNPGSDTDVQARMRSYSVDIDSSRLIWYIDGEVVKDDIGATLIKFHTNPTGTSTRIDIVIVEPNGKTFRETKVISPLDIDLLWEADTYTPPFYKGKALPTHQSMVRTTAIPFFSGTTSPSGFIYNWTMDRTTKMGGGLGKNSITIPAAWSGSKVTVGVEATDFGMIKAGEKYLNIKSVEPMVAFYEIHPLMGVRWNKEVSSVASSGEFRARAIPYFFANEDRRDGKLLYTWKQDGQKLPPSAFPEEYIAVKAADSNGQYVTLTVDNYRKVMQTAKSELSISFTP